MIELFGSEVREYLEAMFHARLPEEVWERIEDKAIEAGISLDDSCLVENGEIGLLRQIACESLVDYDLATPGAGGDEEDLELPMTVVHAKHGKLSRYPMRAIFSRKFRRGKVRELPGSAKRLHYEIRRARQRLCYGL